MKIIIGIILLSMISVATYATSVTVTQTKLQTNSGVLQNIYYQTTSGPGSTTPSTDTSLTPSGSSGSYSISAGTSGYLWSPAFSSATTIPSGHMTFDIWAQLAVASLGIDGSAAAAASGTTIAISLTTTLTNDLLYVSTAEGGSATVSGVTSSPSVTWTRRTSLPFSNNRHLETWYTVWPSSGTITITLTLSSAVSAAGVAYGISGANTAAPFDTNAAVPATSTGTGGTSASVTISTSNSNDMIIGAVGITSTPGLTLGTGFTLILTQTAGTGGNAVEGSDEYQVVASPQTNLAVSYSWSGTNDWGIEADAIVAATPTTITFRTTNSAGTLVSTLLAGTSTNPIPTTKTQVSTVFSTSAGSIPAGGYLEVILTAPSSSSVTVYWGVGQPTNFQVPMVIES